MSDMSQPLPSNHTHVVETRRIPALGAPKQLLAVALVVVLGGSLYQSVRLSNELGSVKQQLSQSQQKMTDLQSEVGTTTADASAKPMSPCENHGELEKARKEAQAGSYRAQIAAKTQAGR